MGAASASRGDAVGAASASRGTPVAINKHYIILHLLSGDVADSGYRTHMQLDQICRVYSHSGESKNLGQ